MDLRTLRVLADDWPAPAILRTFLIPSPAVATDWTITVPGESVWLVQGIMATLVTDANVANRHADLTVTDGSNALYRVSAPFAITATQTANLSWVPLLGYANTALLGNRATIGTGEMVITSGQTIGTTGSALQAGDQWSAITMTVVEVFHGHLSAEQGIVDTIRDRAEAFADIITGRL